MRAQDLKHPRRQANTILASIAASLSLLLILAAASPSRADDPWVVYEGKSGAGAGKHIVFVTGDDEYRSEEGMPMLAKILAFRHGFKTTVLFAIDPEDGTIKPDYQTNIPGLQALETADLMVLFTRFRELPDEQMQHIVDYTDNGGPIIGLRTATHAFNYSRDRDSRFAKFSFNSSAPAGGYGQAVLGDTWINHHGSHGRQSTRGVLNETHLMDPILNGAEDIWGPSDVYGIRNLADDAKVLVYGQVLTGMSPQDGPVEGAINDPMMPLVWTRTHRGESGKENWVLCTTMGAATDLESEGLRRLLVNACYVAVGLEDQVPDEANVEYVGEYEPTDFGFNSYRRGVVPADLRWPPAER